MIFCRFLFGKKNYFCFNFEWIDEVVLICVGKICASLQVRWKNLNWYYKQIFYWRQNFDNLTNYSQTSIALMLLGDANIVTFVTKLKPRFPTIFFLVLFINRYIINSVLYLVPKTSVINYGNLLNDLFGCRLILNLLSVFLFHFSYTIRTSFQFYSFDRIRGTCMKSGSMEKGARICSG